jgi:ABC-type Mn2+/Zn2+ transport system ATPase subunit
LNTDKISYVPQKLNIDKTLPITSQDFLKIFNNSLEKNYIKKISEKYNYEDLLEKKLSNLS